MSDAANIAAISDRMRILIYAADKRDFMTETEPTLFSPPAIDLADDSYLRVGIYRHYKGACYEVFRVVQHSETEDHLVLYRCLYGDFSWWVRPLAMFTETVVVDGNTQPRFKFIGTDAAEVQALC